MYYLNEIQRVDDIVQNLMEYEHHFWFYSKDYTKDRFYLELVRKGNDYDIHRFRYINYYAENKIEYMINYTSFCHLSCKKIQNKYYQGNFKWFHISYNFDTLNDFNFFDYFNSCNRDQFVLKYIDYVMSVDYKKLYQDITNVTEEEMDLLISRDHSMINVFQNIPESIAKKYSDDNILRNSGVNL